MITPSPADAPAEFRAALDSLRAHRSRAEMHVSEIPAPHRIAPFAVALTGELRSGGQEDGTELANGRFILLHDPAGQPAWLGTFRVVTLVRASLEAEMGTDELLGQVAWSWLAEALQGNGANAHSEGGTVTRVVSQSFGALSAREERIEVEIRASWTPDDTGLGAHLAAWETLLCTVVGLPPLPQGVTALETRRRV